MFFQHDPKGIHWGNMTWGHAVSTDLVDRCQLPDAIGPYDGGTNEIVLGRGGRSVKRLIELARSFKREIAVYRRVLQDSRTPRLARWLLGSAVAYALSPIDLIPDFIPVLGLLDDALVLPLLIWLAIRLIPRDIIAEHRAALEQEEKVKPASEPTAQTADQQTNQPQS